MGGLTAPKAALPLRSWNQAAHYSVPASDAVRARKALEEGTAPMERILDRFGVSPTALADRLGIPIERVEGLLEHPRPAPLVVLDAEDALADRADVRAEARRIAVGVLSETARSSGPQEPLRYVRPAGLRAAGGAGDLRGFVEALAGPGSATWRLDGIIYPKVETPEEIRAVCELLDRSESDLGLAPGTIRVGLLVESGWAGVRVAEIAAIAAPRLSSIIVGTVDFSADIGLPVIRNDHPVSDWLRAMVVAVAGAVGVPAIDGMTLDYPVADPALEADANRERFLDRLAVVHRDAVHARDLGLQGKWVGHPAQLFAVLLAFDDLFEPAVLEAHAKALEAFRRSAETDGRGTTIIEGAMSDQATDRHARMVLRRATAAGRFEPARAVALGLITSTERDELTGSGLEARVAPA